MYPKYQTEVFVLRSYDFKESDKIYTILSDKFGLIHIKAKSLRADKSKLRQVMESSVRLRLVLLRARTGWLLTDVLESDIGFRSFSTSRQRVMGAFFQNILRFYAKEEPTNDLFEACEFLYNHLKEKSPKEDTKTVFLKALWRLMHAAGYLKEGLIPDDYSVKDIEEKLNEAVKHSQL